ncbi:hypothetical protein U1Q18_025453 [Sarracenia purpurea var. burkii]
MDFRKVPSKCVESPGMHKLHFVNSCILFGSSSTQIDTSNPLPIYLRGEKYLLKGQIHVNSSLLSGVDELPENMLVNIVNNEGILLEGTTARLVTTGDDQVLLYTSIQCGLILEKNLPLLLRTHDVWLILISVVTNALCMSLMALIICFRNKDEKKILFYHRQHDVLVSQDGCQALVPHFSGRPGMYIEGSVSPPLSSVYVRIIAVGDSRYVLLKKGDLAIESVTGTDALYVGGPLYDDISYRIEGGSGPLDTALPLA